MSTSLAVGANVRAELARRGLSQRTLADHLGLSVTGISKRLNGKTPINVDELQAIAEMLCVDPAALLQEVA